MNNRRSASVGALPVEKKHFVSRNESASGAVLDVRCACQYFQCESLLPDRINPVDSRPTSKQGFISDMEHEDHPHFDNISTRSFNMMGGRSTEFDRLSTASFGGRKLVVRSISDATEPEMVGGMMAGRRGKQMSVGRLSSGSGRDADAISIRSGISIRRVSRSPSHADLIVADLNIPTPYLPSKFSHMTNQSHSTHPDLNTFERMSRSRSNRRTQDQTLPQNKPIDVSKFKENPQNEFCDTQKFNMAYSTTDQSTFGDTALNQPKSFETKTRSPERDQHIQKRGGAYSMNDVLPQNKPIDVSMYEDEPLTNIDSPEINTYERHTRSPDRFQRRTENNLDIEMEEFRPQNKPINVSMYEGKPNLPAGISAPLEIPKLNIVAPTPTPLSSRKMAPPDFNIYDRKTNLPESIKEEKWGMENKQVMPQNQPIDVSMYEDQFTSSAIFDVYDNKSAPSTSTVYSNRLQGHISDHQFNVLPQNQPINISRYQDEEKLERVDEQMEVEIEPIEAVVDVRDNIRIQRMSPPLEENVPDLSPIVENETKIEITDFAPQPDMRTIDEILADDKNTDTTLHLQQSSQPNQLKRHYTQSREMSPTNSKKPSSLGRFSPSRGGTEQMDTGFEHYSNGINNFSTSHMTHHKDKSQFLQGKSPEPHELHHVEEKRFMHYGSVSPGTQPSQRSFSPSSPDLQKAEQSLQRASPPAAYFQPEIVPRDFQRGSSVPPNQSKPLLQRGSPYGVSFKQNINTTHSSQQETPQSPQTDIRSFQRASSPMSGITNIANQPSQRASSPAGVNTQNSLQLSSSKPLQEPHSTRASSPLAVNTENTSKLTSKPLQRASSPTPLTNKREDIQVLSRKSPPLEFPEMEVAEKQSYSSRFMSMFHTKPSDKSETLPDSKRKLSVNQIFHMDRGRSPSPSAKQVKASPDDKGKLSVSNVLNINQGRSPSPAKQVKPNSSPSTSRLMSVFKREKVEHSSAMEVVEEKHVTNMSVQKPPEKPPLTVKVTETFSLKVDEMDQYCSRPPKSPSPIRQTYPSSDHLRLSQDRISESISFSGNQLQPFTPVILSSDGSSQVLIGSDRRQYTSSSQYDLRGSQRIDSHEYIHQIVQTITIGNKKLVSVPIALPDSYDSKTTSSEFISTDHEDHKKVSHLPRSNFIRAPSEQRLAQSKLLQRKARASDRTQSQDRAAADRASDLDSLSIGTRSMSKTVSFNFGEHGSRLSQHEKMASSNNQLDKKNWLERTYFSRDHEYEPIGEPSTEIQAESTTEKQESAIKKESSPAPQTVPTLEISQPSIEITNDEVTSPSKPDELKEVEELQKEIEERYFTSAVTTTPPTESQSDYELQTSQLDSSALDEVPSEAEIKKKGFIASAQDKTRRMQAGIKNQAGKIKTKFRTTKKAPSGSPKAKERKRFKAPEFSKMKMPEIKRPEFTKFSKPDMSKFKLPDKFSSLKLNRSRSFKEPTEVDDTTVSGTSPESTSAPPKKQRFDFSFGTYPRAFKKKSKVPEVEGTVDEPSVLPSTETQPSAESSSTPQGDRGPGPVRSRWADKFSDVSYNDSEGSRYRRFDSEQESSFDRESSMERRMKEVLEENAKEEAELAMLGAVEQKQFADYDEENRVIHEISKTREKEFKRRPMVHQDSDLVSEEGRDIGWTEREAQRNEMLRKAELEAEQRLRHLEEREQNMETASTASSSKKYVFEKINPKEFFANKKFESEEEKKSYLDEPQLYDVTNSLELIGSLRDDSVEGSNNYRADFGYDVPPPKPRRLSQQQRQRNYDSENASQVDEYADDISLSQAGSEYFKQPPPSRPLRRNRFKDSQDMSIGGTPSLQFDDEDYTDRSDRNHTLPQEYDDEKENIQRIQRSESPMPPPQPPRRRRKQQRESLEKDAFVNGFSGRSVSNSFLKEDNKPEEVIVYRTEHEYKIPLATPENYTDNSGTPCKSKSLSRLGYDEDDRTSRGADSLDLREDNDKGIIEQEQLHEKYIIEMMENDGYAVVRKDNLPKPTPPARRKKFSRSPGERFATMPHVRKGSPSVPEQNSSSRNYSTIGKPTPPRRRSALSLGADSQKDFGSQDFTDYEEEPELEERTESPRNLQSGDIINKMKYRPLPPPPRPPREKKHSQRDRHGADDDEIESRDDRDGGGERIISEQSSEDNYQQDNIEVEVSTQTDPLPDDFVCEEFEITDDMKIIKPRRSKTLDEILKEEEEAELERAKQIDEEILQRGIQRFREANQRSASEKSRASSQAKSLSRPQTPSAILIEKRIPTPVPNSNGQTVLEASLTVQPIDDLDLEEELLRKEGLYDGSHSKSDGGSHCQGEEGIAHESEEENARVDEEVRSYTRSTDAESQQKDEDEHSFTQSNDALEQSYNQRKYDKEDEEYQQFWKKKGQELLALLESERPMMEERVRIQMEKDRLDLEEEEEEKEVEEEKESESQHINEELSSASRTKYDKEDEEYKRILKAKREELETEKPLLEERLRIQLEKERLEIEEEEREQVRREKQQLRQRLLNDLEKEKKTESELRTEENESYVEDPNERLEGESSHELKLQTSVQKEQILQPLPVSDINQQELRTEPEQEHITKEENVEKLFTPPPMAPPRKRSATTDNNESMPVSHHESTTAPVPFTGAMPSHLAIADLEVERLRVHALQAGQIMVSHLHGAQISAEELECQSGNLVVRNIELPPGFIEDIVERVRSTEREHSQVATQTVSDTRTQTEEEMPVLPPPIPTRQQEQPPIRPPPPHRESVFAPEYMQPPPFVELHETEGASFLPRTTNTTDYLQNIPPVGFYNPRIQDDGGEHPPPVYRRRRHHRRRDSSSEEDHHRRRSRSIRPEQQTVAQAGRQFISACSLPLANLINQLTNAVRPNNDNKQDQVQPRNISAVVVLCIVMALSFLIYFLTGRNIHHHHWDFFNPPGNDGRLA